MICDFNNFPDEHIFQTEVCVVGSGPAGIAVCNEFRDSATQVLLLESGGRTLEPETQNLCEGEVIGLRHNGLLTGRARILGGTSKLWAGQCLRLDPIDFEPREWVPLSGWPVSHAEMTAFYERAEAFFDVRGEFYDERQYRRFGLSEPAWSEDSLRTMFTVYTPEVDTIRAFRNRLRQATNMITLLHANVVEIETSEDGSVTTALRIRTLAGKQGRVNARIFVISAGGIENARLLLSSNRQQSKGVGNDRDLVGRCFQEHPNGFTGTLADGDADTLQRLFRLFFNSKRRYFPKFSLSPAQQRKHSVLNCNAHLTFEYPDDSAMATMQAFYRAARGRKLPDKLFARIRSLATNCAELPLALIHWLRTGRTPVSVPSAIKLQCYLEQAPNRTSRVKLSSQKDALGMPKIQMDWHMTDLELKTVGVMTETVRSEFARLGLGTWRPHAWLDDRGEAWQEHLSDCAHHIGTTRMAKSRSTGVVDPQCAVFGVKGLYIAGSSVFPTSGYANPTLTIVALALRLADHLKEKLAIA